MAADGSKGGSGGDYGASYSFSSCIRTVILLCIILCSVKYSATEEAFATSYSVQRSKPSVLSLFNLGRTSKFWSDKLLRRSYDDLERSESRDFSKEAVSNYTAAGSISSYLNFTEVDAIYLPVPINFIFVGFDGHGNQDVKLGEEELERWFTNIDNVLEHTRIPQLGEALTPFYRVGADGEQRHHLPLVSYTHYNYSVHAIEMDAEVTKVFEYAIKVFSRRENPADQRPDAEVSWQVDMDSMAYLFESLVHYLQLDDAYNVFVLNPKRDEIRRAYGYRRGLSESELKLIRGDPKLRTVKGVRHRHPLDIEKFKRPLYQRHPMLKFAWTSSKTTDMAQWVQTYLATLRSIEDSMRNKNPEELVSLQAQQILGGKSQDLAAVLRRVLRAETEFDFAPECLVDTWVGQGRWAFMDLTAGPFSWGPTVGGEGVRTAESLPSVERHFGHLRVNGEVVSADDGVQELQDTVQDRFATFEGDEAAVDMLLAEIDVYEMFAEKHCRGRKIKITLCQELQERMDDIKGELDAFQNQKQDEAHQKKALEALKRVDKWNIFGDIHEHVQNFSVARDSFLAHLGATLASSMKHVVTPSTAEGAFHFYDKVSFQLYIMTQERTKHINLLPLDVSVLKDAISTLALPTQTFQYSVNLLGLSEDPALAMAFSVARRAAILPVLLMNGTYKLSTRNYLDSIILQHQLQQLSTRNAKSAPTLTKSSLEVPIFWFIRTGDPVLIDKHYLAKALPDMVIVIQSGKSSWESHLQCNGRSITWDPSSPVKAAVAAVAEHLAGLMPTHLTYSHAHDNADEDWTWSAGNHPFSSTSAGYKLSAFQVDAIARSYIITALDDSIQIVNSATVLLSKELTSEQTFRTFKSREHSLLFEYNSVVNLWRRIALLTEGARFGEAVKLLPSLRYASERFMKQTNDPIDALHPIHCTQQRKLDVSGDILAGVAFVAVLFALWLLLRSRRVKPKIN